MQPAQLRLQITESFNEEELRNLCFDLQIDYDSLGGTGKSNKARELVLLMQRSGRMSELLDACRRFRPQLEWLDLEKTLPGKADSAVISQSSSASPYTKPIPSIPPVNPFTYGNPISDPDRFFGRDRVIEQVFSRLRNAEHESSSLVGGRRIGKTSLLNYLGHPEVRLRYGLDPEQYIFIFVDLQMVDSSVTPARLWERLLQQIARHCRDEELKRFIDDAIKVGSFDSFALADIFDVVDRRDQHIVFLLDEFENVTGNPNFGPDFFYSLRSLAIQHNLSLVTSSDRELIELTHSDAVRSSPFFNIFANIYVRLFSEAEAMSLLEGSLKESDISFSNKEAFFRFFSDSEQWERIVNIDESIPVKGVAQIGDGSIVIAGDAFVAQTLDYGATWEIIGDASADVGNDIKGLAQDTAGQLWAGSYSGGMSVLSEGQWQHLQR